MPRVFKSSDLRNGIEREMKPVGNVNGIVTGNVTERYLLLNKISSKKIGCFGAVRLRC